MGLLSAESRQRLYSALADATAAREVMKLLTANGAYHVSAGEATNDITASIPTGLTTITSLIVQIRRAGAVVTADAVVAISGGSFTVANGGSTYALGSTDIIYWMANGTG